VLCANIDVGLPGTAMVDTDGGPLGVIGLTHPATHLFSQAPAPADDWADRVRLFAGDLRSQGALAVVVLLHDGADWWPGLGPEAAPVEARSQRLADLATPWASMVDLILGGHTPAAWTGQLAATPAGHAAIFASSVLVVDVLAPPAAPAVRGVSQVPALRPAPQTEATDVLDAAAAEVVAELQQTWISRTGAEKYLPDLLATALRNASGADAGLVFASQHTTQGALDGAVAALPAGPVSRLDVTRLFGFDDDRPAVVHCAPGEFRTAVEAHNAVSDPTSTAADRIWWNWCRMPAGTSTDSADPRTVAVLPHILPRLAELLGRDLVSEPAPIGARAGLIQTLR
jgi:2',3'-cyclic-nucleotide 2'-phosphodiesterase (5'-nucleotidase family)